jgi:acetylornithine/N-succinyldiaminopimelate aminotransferase
MQHIIWSTTHPIRLNNIVKASNCTLSDSQGNTFTDMESGVWCTSIGHNHPKLCKILHEQVDNIWHTGFNYCNPIIEEAAKEVLQITGMQGGKCELLSSGSEAVEYGMRIARTLSNDRLAFTFADSYFGAYGDAVVKQPDKWFVYDRLNCSCQHPDGCTGSCNDFDQIPFERIGIFLFEPGSSYGMVRFANQALIDKIYTRIKENNGLVVINEITTGIGRTGKWLGVMHYSITPDIVAIGKGIGNGYPVSVVAINEQVAMHLQSKTFLYSQSHQNDPLGAAVVKGVIEIIREEHLVEKTEAKGRYLIAELQKLQAVYPIIKSIRGRGLMIAIEFESKADDLFDELFKAGYLLARRAGTQVVRLDPALTIETGDLEAFLQVLRNLLAGVSHHSHTAKPG